MRLGSLLLENFRQFKDARIDFASDAEKNVTVIHGGNGSGKTTILNAFTWLMYGEVDFDTRPDRLANEGAMAAIEPGQRVRVEVTLKFEHEENEYEAVRWAEYEKESADDFDGDMVDSDLVVVYWDDSGTRHRRDNPMTALSQILPKRLSGLFFFDGEDIDELAGVDNQGRIKESIQNIMGLTILERSIDHLKKVESRFEDVMQESGGEELAKLVDEKKQLNKEIEDNKELKRDKEQTVDQLDTAINDIKQKLEKFSDTADLEKERKQEEARLEELEEQIEEINDSIRDQISRSGFLTFAMPAIRDTAEDLDDLRERGLIPSELSAGFVDQLLNRGECICGRQLEEGTEHYEEVAGWKSEMSSAGIDQAAIRIIAHLEGFVDKRASFFSEIEELVTKRSKLKDQKRAAEERIDEIGTELDEMDTPSGRDQESPAELEQSRRDKSQKRDEILRQIGDIDRQIEDLQDELEETEKAINEAREDQEVANQARRRWQAAQEVRKELEKSFGDLQDTVRHWADQLIDETFSGIAQKDFQAEITEDFALKIWQDVGDSRVEVDKSTGERQIASLAFIGSLVSIAKERYQEDTDSPYFTGGIYPIVMDSPFGALDKEHRRKVSRALPALGEQVVVMATDSQWEGPVEEEMDDIAGAQYWLDFDEGDGPNEYPQTQVVAEKAVAQVGD